jgi:hypothetical protein
MIVALNYADKNFKKRQKINTKTAYLLGKVDKVYSFSPEDIDNDFLSKNKNILSQKRGAGLWLWKPYFINKVLDEISDGDVLIYLDSGGFYVRKVNTLIEKLRDSKQEIMLFEQPLIECQWTKKTVLISLDAYTDEIRFSNQTLGIMIIIKSARSCAFVERWLELCQQEELICPKEKDETEDFMFISHREDQSILSVLGKKEKIIPFSDPSNFGKLPEGYLRKYRFFSLFSQIPYQHKINKVYFLLTRKDPFLRFLLSYTVKSLLRKVRLSILHI